MENFEYYFSLLGGSGIILMFLTKLVNLLLPDKLPNVYIIGYIPNRYEEKVVDTLKCCFEESSDKSKFTYYQKFNRSEYLNVTITHDDKYKVLLKPNSKVYFYNDKFLYEQISYNLQYKLSKPVQSKILHKMWKGNRSEWNSEFHLQTEEYPISSEHICDEYGTVIKSMIHDKICDEDITKEQIGIEFTNTTNTNIEFIIDEVFLEQKKINYKPTKKFRLFGFYIYLEYT